MRHSADHLQVREHVVAAGTEWTGFSTGWIFLQITDGAGYLLTAGTTLALDAGDLVVLLPHTDWVVRSSQLGRLRAVYFGADPTQLDGLFSLADQQALRRAARSAERRPWHLPATHPVAEQFRALARAARSADALAHRGTLLQLATTVWGQFLGHTMTTASPATTTEAHFLELVRDRTAQDLAHEPVTALARQCGCSPRHFARLFKAHFGRSFQQEKMAIRLRRACQLLATTDEKIATIAADCGLPHVGLFCQMFKKHFKTTPTQWRRQARRRATVARARR